MVKRTPKAPRHEPPLLDPVERLQGCSEVTLGFTAEEARAEALRCLDCKDPTCIAACPLHIDVPSFIRRVIDADYAGAFQTITETNPFPDICGRVCQHELYCEKLCLLGKKLDPVAIGALERFVADHQPASDVQPPPNSGPKVAMVGSGPASLIAAYDLARRGYRIRIFEALHDFGGVLRYGIPPFRLPREVIDEEIQRLRQMGVELESDCIVGRSCTLDELFAEGYAAVFVATGAGLPYLMGVPGEMLIGVYTANEFLTRINLMGAYDKDADTPMTVGSSVAVIGGGNTAMDAVRSGIRMGAEHGYIVYRRSEKEMTARVEEYHHAQEEGVEFLWLTNPVAVLGNEAGWVTGLKCQRMVLGAPDASGRARPVPVPDSEFVIPVDTVVLSIGTTPNPLLTRTTKGLDTNKWGCVVADERTGLTSKDQVYAGGDAVTGAATVILAAGAGKRAAQAIHEALSGTG